MLLRSLRRMAIGPARPLLRQGNRSTLGTWLRRGVATAAVLLALAAVLKLEDGPATAASASGGPVPGVTFEGWERFSRARMTESPQLSLYWPPRWST